MSAGVNRTRAAAAVVAVIALIVIGVMCGVARSGSDVPRPEDVPFEVLALPEVVNAPGPWSADEGVDGPLAALGLSMRTTPDGVSGERQGFELFGVSAVDGHAAWIGLPGDEVYDFALSPDGRWIGWSRHRGRGSPRGPALLGWAVMDTTTGDIRELRDPDARRVRDSMADLEFSGDSQYLLTSYEALPAPARRGDQFVAWNVDDGIPTVLEKPGHGSPMLG